jgi:hypothetical protein
MTSLYHIRGIHFVDTPISGPFQNSEVLIPKITLYHEGNSSIKVPFYWYQFPVAFMTINKCQGQSMNQVSLVLKGQVFAHVQLYVGLSCVKNVDNLCVTQIGSNPDLLNIVVKRIFGTGLITIPNEQDVIILD